jgi:hypothetical protein
METKPDIIQQIKAYYMKKGPDTRKDIEPLVPTKAALFGLDLRFRASEQAML